MRPVGMKLFSRTSLVVIGLCLFLFTETRAQGTLYATTSGQTSFYSATPGEDINALNKKTQVMLNTTTGEITVLMNMRDFDFPNELMEKHFNETYLESARYPKATFKGKLDRAVDLTKQGRSDLSATGTFTVHGVSQPRTLKGTLTVRDGSLLLDTDFEVALTDHQIKIPKIVFVKIVQLIQVKTSYALTPYKK